MYTEMQAMMKDVSQMNAKDLIQLRDKLKDLGSENFSKSKTLGESPVGKAWNEILLRLESQLANQASKYSFRTLEDAKRALSNPENLINIGRLG